MESNEGRRTLHLTNIIELSDLAEEAVEAACENDCRFDEDGNLSENPLWTKEAAEQELRRLRGEGNPMFTIRNGQWMGKPIRDHLMMETVDEMRDDYLSQESKKICTIMRSAAAWHQMPFGDDITDDVLLSLFSVQWYAKLKALATLAEWKKAHNVPDVIPDSEDAWYVDLGKSIEIGSLEYVASEYCRDGLFFPYKISTHSDAAPSHEHSFEAILQAALDFPETFSIEGYEEYYSHQERRFLQSFVQKLLADKKAAKPQKV